MSYQQNLIKRQRYDDEAKVMAYQMDAAKRKKKEEEYRKIMNEARQEGPNHRTRRNGRETGEDKGEDALRWIEEPGLATSGQGQKYRDGLGGRPGRYLNDFGRR